MTGRTASRLAWLIWAVSIAAILFAAVEGRSHDNDAGERGAAVATVAFLLAFSTVGALVASRRRTNPIGWLLLAAGAGYAAGGVAVSIDPDETNAVALWVSSWTWGVGSLLAVNLLLLFPDGRLPSHRWRPVAGATAVGICAWVVGAAFAPGPIEDTALRNPFGIGGIGRTLFPALRDIGIAVGLAAGMIAIVSLFVRLRRADPQAREQLRWLVFAGAIVLLATVAQIPISRSIDDEALRTNVLNAVVSLAITLLPIAIGIAILKHRLYDIDLVIRKTLVYGALAAFVTVVYVGIVVGVGALVGSRSNIALSIAATAIVALAFQPVRERANHVANRLVYGKRATPYEILARFGDRVASTYASEDVLPRIARTVAEGTGAERVEVWLHLSDAWRPGAVWPPGAGEEQSRDVGSPSRASAHAPAGSVEVRHRGELLGAIEVQKPANEPLTPAELGLLEDLTGQAGLVLSNARLTAELQERVDALARRTAELRESRRRIVAAHDTERRRLERNIHDGAQQHLVALAVKLRLAKAIIAKDPERGVEVLRELRMQLGDAIETLTSLALGIYPPVLEERGIGAAIETQARVGSVPVTVDADGVGRAPIESEAAVYFCCLEAIQNAAKYAEASRVVVRLSRDGDDIAFEVTDDGRGFDPSTTPPGSGLRNMADRLSVLGGTVDVTSSVGHGTTVRGRLPATVESR